jgi:branched-chain amino acid transport system permease protein
MTALNSLGHVAAQARWRGWEYALWAVLFVLPFVLPKHAALVNEIAIVALFAMSLDLVLGYRGIVSLGHAAFLGFGAYSAALFAKHIHADPLLGLAIAIAATALLGLLCAFTILRGSDLTRLMVTLGVSLVLFELANKLDFLTGGADGLQGVVMASLLGRFEFDLQGQTAAWYSLTVLLCLFIVLRRVMHSPWGYTVQTLRDNALRASAVGIATSTVTVQLYVLAAAVAGGAGALMAQTTGFASLDVFSVERSADLMLIVVIGGLGWMYGGLFGAIVFKLLHDLISSVTPQYWGFWMGLFLVLLVLLGRDRLIAALNPFNWLKKAAP